MSRKEKEEQKALCLSSSRETQEGRGGRGREWDTEKSCNIGREGEEKPQGDLLKNAWKQLPISCCIVGTLINELTELNPKDAFTIILSSGIQYLICIPNHDKTYLLQKICHRLNIAIAIPPWKVKAVLSVGLRGREVKLLRHTVSFVKKIMWCI